MLGHCTAHGRGCEGFTGNPKAIRMPYFPFSTTRKWAPLPHTEGSGLWLWCDREVPHRSYLWFNMLWATNRSKQIIFSGHTIVCIFRTQYVFKMCVYKIYCVDVFVTSQNLRCDGSTFTIIANSTIFRKNSTFHNWCFILRQNVEFHFFCE